MHACIVNAPHRDFLEALIEFANEEPPRDRILPYISYFRPKATPPTDASGCYTCDPDTWRTDTVRMIAEIELGNEIATALGRAISRGSRGESVPPAVAGGALGRTARDSLHGIYDGSTSLRGPAPLRTPLTIPGPYCRSTLAQPRGSPRSALVY